MLFFEITSLTRRVHDRRDSVPFLPLAIETLSLPHLHACFVKESVNKASFFFLEKKKSNDDKVLHHWRVNLLFENPPRVNFGGFLSNLHSCIQKSGPSELCIFLNICRIKTSNFKDSRDQMTALAFKHLRSVASKGRYCASAASSCIGSLSTFWLHLRGKKKFLYLFLIFDFSGGTFHYP